MLEMHKNTHKVDQLLLQIVDYTHGFNIADEALLEQAKICLLDSMGCAMLALKKPMCKGMLGPIIPDTIVPHGSRVPGTNFVLDPIQATFNISTMIRWLDFNDTWLAAEWGHPSDNIGAILAVADYVSQRKKVKMLEVLKAIVIAYEIQGILALENSFNAVGLDHVILVKIASAAVASLLLGGSKEQTISAVSNAWIDGHSLRTYRHGLSTGSRKSWAAGDAAARGVRLAWMALAGEGAYPHALDAKQWGFRDVLWHGKALKLSKPFAHYVIENILFKVLYPAEFHGQTAVEAGIILHPEVVAKLDQIETIEVHTQLSAMRIINKTGELRNYADRDHCLQYMLAVALINGSVTTESYSDAFANADPRINILRDKMQVSEDMNYSLDYLEPDKRAIANSVQVFFKDGTATEIVEVLYPLGHRSRRAEAEPLLHDKYIRAINSQFTDTARQALANLWKTPASILIKQPVHEFMALWNK